jgi:hypothetical protein
MVTRRAPIPSQKDANCGLSHPSGGLEGHAANIISMPDIASLLLRSSIGALPATVARCGSCGRYPLAGETVQRLADDRLACDLCFAKLPSDRRVAVRSERVHASERPLAVAPKAA